MSAADIRSAHARLARGELPRDCRGAFEYASPAPVDRTCDDDDEAFLTANSAV
jgi:hypothetical protein